MSRMTVERSHCSAVPELLGMSCALAPEVCACAYCSSLKGTAADIRRTESTASNSKIVLHLFILFTDSSLVVL